MEKKNIKSNFNKFFKNNPVIKNLHLLISVIVIIPIALVYGVKPGILLLKLFDIKVETINLTGIFRAIMGLYLAMASIWIIGIFKPKFWTIATVTNIVFMGGLSVGRILSLVLDGLPSIYFVFGLLLELTLAFWGTKNLKKYSDLFSN